MTKGTPSSGRHNREGNHIRCRRCGRHSYHVKKGVCSACGFGRMARLRDYHWCTKSRPSYGNKSHNRRTQAREKWRTGNQNNMTKTAVEKR